MKNIFIYIIGACLSLSLVSCDNEIEIWDSATLDYSGSYLYTVTLEDGTLDHAYNNEYMLEFYNTSANVENEIFIDDHDKYFEMRSKFSLDGDYANFKSKSIVFADLADNEKALVVPSGKPTALNETKVETRTNIRAAIVEGKIISKGATTLGGNVADSLYVKMTLYSGTVNFKSVSVPVEYRANPDKEEFAWEFESVVHDATKDETVIIAGHRFTGFSEDEY